MSDGEVSNGEMADAPINQLGELYGKNFFFQDLFLVIESESQATLGDK